MKLNLPELFANARPDPVAKWACVGAIQSQKKQPTVTHQSPARNKSEGQKARFRNHDLKSECYAHATMSANFNHTTKTKSSFEPSNISKPVLQLLRILLYTNDVSGTERPVNQWVKLSACGHIQGVGCGENMIPHFFYNNPNSFDCCRMKAKCLLTGRRAKSRLIAGLVAQDKPKLRFRLTAFGRRRSLAILSQNKSKERVTDRSPKPAPAYEETKYRRLMIRLKHASNLWDVVGETEGRWKLSSGITVRANALSYCLSSYKYSKWPKVSPD